MDTPGCCLSQDGQQRSGSGSGGMGWGLGRVGLLVLLAGGPLWATPPCCRLQWGAGVVGLATVKRFGAGGCRPLLKMVVALPLLDALGGGAGLLTG